MLVEMLPVGDLAARNAPGQHISRWIASDSPQASTSQNLWDFCVVCLNPPSATACRLWRKRPFYNYSGRGAGERAESGPSLILTRGQSPIDSPELMKVCFGDLQRQIYTILPMQEGVNVKAHRGYRKEI